MKFYIILIAFIAFISCKKSTENESIKNYTFTIDSVLTQNGTRSLPIDINGYYHLRITTSGSPQSHRVTGRILVDGKEPNPNEKITFESNLFWWMRQGDTSAIVTQSYINYFTGEYTIINLPPMIAKKDELVPTTNCCSYSGKGGK